MRLQVSLATLLNNFMSVSLNIKGEKERKLCEERRRLQDGLNPLRPLLRHLALVRSA